MQASKNRIQISKSKQNDKCIIFFVFKILLKVEKDFLKLFLNRTTVIIHWRLYRKKGFFITCIVHTSTEGILCFCIFFNTWFYDKDKLRYEYDKY